MPRTSQQAVTSRLSRIRDVADDLSRELFRVPVLPNNIVYEMVAAIKADADAALRALKKPQR
jgi:hypothetical protein